MATEAGAGTLVLDASAVVRLICHDPAAAGWAEQLAEASMVLAPELMLTEVANALWKLQRSGSLVDHLEPDRELQVEALALACHLDHPVYDCLYLALARREAARILTADQRPQRLANQVLP
ncbi:type II toxin-antitoxin system VapC family toxin [Synechococcus sp. CBW1108]|uniref:type II toxin-antitoxin system VapC family toxin n=1 Tax=Synechococcus sp. CBW1108 TaxID=1353147 RepID=UPI0018CE4A40|nr:type II toxin-antitoxin system VapC family toxin [Synechococcus sp. CBW1108]QPN71503.1 type II toxin-antitoxin system VapC family toxin [Synechococcus sp. CBW1108]